MNEECKAQNGKHVWIVYYKEYMTRIKMKKIIIQPTIKCRLT